jgi:hypothetical protein
MHDILLENIMKSAARQSAERECEMASAALAPPPLSRLVELVSLGSVIFRQK